MISLTTNTRGTTKLQTEADPAKVEKTKESKVAKKAKKVKAAVVEKDTRPKILIEFDARVGTNRAKLLETLHSKFRSMVKRNALLKAVYGSMNVENIGALNMSLKGATDTIKKSRLPYQIKKDGKGEEASIGLYPKA